MRRHGVEGANAAVAERAAHLLDDVRFRVERVANHQKNASGAETLGLRDDSLAGRGTKNDFVHLTKDDATRGKHELLLTLDYRARLRHSRMPDGDPNLPLPWSQNEERPRLQSAELRVRRHVIHRGSGGSCQEGRQSGTCTLGRSRRSRMLTEWRW